MKAKKSFIWLGILLLAITWILVRKTTYPTTVLMVWSSVQFIILPINMMVI